MMLGPTPQQTTSGRRYPLYVKSRAVQIFEYCPFFLLPTHQLYNSPSSARTEEGIQPSLYQWRTPSSQGVTLNYDTCWALPIPLWVGPHCWPDNYPLIMGNNSLSAVLCLSHLLKHKHHNKPGRNSTNYLDLLTERVKPHFCIFFFAGGIHLVPKWDKCQVGLRNLKDGHSGIINPACLQRTRGLLIFSPQEW